jgi:hypothetical protein
MKRWLSEPRCVLQRAERWHRRGGIAVPHGRTMKGEFGDAAFLKKAQPEPAHGLTVAAEVAPRAVLTAWLTC